ncbi:TPA: GNAT family N-acetyltransferase [Vibrio diabolicus]|uniref:GNAT family N-acetyltransferase n=1 Tax=Vibrio diabolicus TaxID=50719 RepID=UPI00375346E9
MDIYPEIELSKAQHNAIEALRNKSFPEHQVDRSYYKQLPHMRVLKYEGDHLVGYMGLDYRVVRVGDEIYKVLGVSDFCVESTLQRQGIGTTMLSQLSEYASTKDVDFIILVSDLDRFYVANGYVCLNSLSSWLRVHEHKNYGVAVEQVDDLYVKPISGKIWAVGHIDWLGYMY